MIFLDGGAVFAGRSGLVGAAAWSTALVLGATFSVETGVASMFVELCATAGGRLSFAVIAVSPHELSDTKTRADGITRTICLLASQFGAVTAYNIVKKVFDRLQFGS